MMLNNFFKKLLPCEARNRVLNAERQTAVSEIRMASLQVQHACPGGKCQRAVTSFDHVGDLRHVRNPC
jgi:hypothetical protein